MLAEIGLEHHGVAVDGGLVVVDADGPPDRAAAGAGESLVDDLVLPYPVDMLVDAIDRAGQQYVREGITSVRRGRHRRRLDRQEPGRARGLPARPRAGPAARAGAADGDLRRAAPGRPETAGWASTSGCAPASATSGSRSAR